MKARRCCLWGQDGLDLDVARNLVPFYRGLGFQVVLGTPRERAELLVVARAHDIPSDLSSCDPLAVHVWDYGGWNFDAFLRGLDPERTWVFCVSEARRERILSGTGFPPRRVLTTLPPVDVPFWSRAPAPVRWEHVHVGHFKAIEPEDAVQLRFLEHLRGTGAHVWGRGWDGRIAPALRHGPCSSTRASSIYARSRWALGLMYPFQRDTTFSGRFWQAPLAGCALLSEPGLFTRTIPGVVEFPDRGPIRSLPPLDRDRIRVEAAAFWEESNRRTRELVAPTVCGCPSRRLGLREAFRLALGLLRLRVRFGGGRARGGIPFRPR